MRRLEWVRFRWDLAKSVPDPVADPAPFRIRPAEPPDKPEILKVVRASFGLDSEWASYLNALEEHLMGRLEHGLPEKGIGCLTLLHGSRVIGCSAFDLSREAPNHLLTGPCLVIEYRRRGLGTILLGATLRELKNAGLQSAYGVTKNQGVSARHIYPKFGGLLEDENYAAGLAAP